MATVQVFATEVRPASHSAGVERRTAGGGAFFPIGSGDSVTPFEPIRLVASNVDFQSFNEPEFLIRDAQGRIIFQAKKAASMITGIATVDIMAPGLPGNYELTIHAQSFPFFPTTHSSKVGFAVAADALPPPDGDGLDMGGDILVSVERRTADGSSFFPIVYGGAVAPGEAIRVSAQGGILSAGAEFEFRIVDPSGRTLFSRRARANLAGNAFIDLAAPGLPGNYALVVTKVALLPFLSVSAHFMFVVTSTPLPPIPPPPDGDGFFEDIGEDIGDGLEGILKPAKGLLWAGGFLLLGIAGVMLVPKLARG